MPRWLTETTHRFRVSEEDAGLRLDQILARCVPGLSRRKARLVLDLGGVFVDRKRVKVAGRTLRPGQWVEVHMGAVLARSIASKDRSDLYALPIEPVVRYVDEALVVVDKPAGVLSAPTPESDRSNLQSWLERELGAPVHVIHRLDRLTSGLLVFARQAASAARLTELLQQRLLSREYLLAVRGCVPFENREVREPVRGKAAHTALFCEERRDVASLLRARLGTGRTHQIRFHAASLGHPVLGDPVYGRGACESLPVRPPRLALHAARLAFPHPGGSLTLELDSPWPSELTTWWRELNRSCVPRSDRPPDPSSRS